MRRKEFVKDSEDVAIDPNALVQHVIRESYMQANEDLKYLAEKVKYYNQLKKRIREYLRRLRDYDAKIRIAAHDKGIDLCAIDSKTRTAMKRIVAGFAFEVPNDNISKAIGLPKRFSSSDLREIEAEIENWEEKLNTMGDDAQLANVDMQNVLQKQQQYLQMMSNISKMQHDTAMAVISKMGG